MSTRIQYDTSAHSSSRSTPEPDLYTPSLRFANNYYNNDCGAREQLRRNLTEIARDAAVDARNARKGSINEEYIRRLVEEVEVELGVRRAGGANAVAGPRPETR